MRFQQVRIDQNHSNDKKWNFLGGGWCSAYIRTWEKRYFQFNCVICGKLEIFGKLEIYGKLEIFGKLEILVNSKYGKLEISNLPNSEFTIFRVYQKFRVYLYSKIKVSPKQTDWKYLVC